MNLEDSFTLRLRPWQTCPFSQGPLLPFLCSAHVPWALLHALRSAWWWPGHSEGDPPRLWKLAVRQEVLSSRSTPLRLVSAAVKVNRGPGEPLTSSGELRETSLRTSHLQIRGENRSISSVYYFYELLRYIILIRGDKSTHLFFRIPPGVCI